MRSINRIDLNKWMVLLSFTVIVAPQIFAQAGTPEIQGPDKIQWASEATYVLVIKNGTKVTKSGLTVDWASDGKVLLPRVLVKGQRQVVKTRNNPGGDFEESTFVLSASALLQTPAGTKKVTARKTITISDVEKECEKIDAKIKGNSEKLSKLQTLIGRLENKKRAIQDLKVDEVAYDILPPHVDKNQVKMAGEELEASRQLKQSLITNKTNIKNVRNILWENMPEKTRLVNASGHFKNSSKTQQDKRDFVWGVYGPNKTIRNLDTEVGLAEKVVINKLIGTVGNGLTSIGGLITLGAGGGSTAIKGFLVGGVLRGLTGIAIRQYASYYVGMKMQPKSFNDAFTYSDGQINQLLTLTSGISKSAAILENLKKTGAGERKIRNQRVKLQQAVIAAYEKSIQTMNSLPPAQPVQELINGNGRLLRNLEEKLVISDAFYAKQAKERAFVKSENEKLARRREYIQREEIDPKNRELDRFQKENAKTKESQSEHCSESNEAPQNPVSKKSSENSETNYDSHILGEWVIAMDGNSDATIIPVTQGMSIKFVRENGSISGYIIKLNQNALDRGFTPGQLIVRNGQLTNWISSKKVTGDIVTSQSPVAWKKGHGHAVEIDSYGLLRLGNPGLYTFRFKRPKGDDADKIIGRRCRQDGACVGIQKTGKGKYEGFIDNIDNERRWSLDEKVYRDVEFLEDGEYRGNSLWHDGKSGQKSWKITTLGLSEEPALLVSKVNGKVWVYVKMK